VTYRSYVLGIILLALTGRALFELYASNSVGCDAFDRSESDFLAYCDSARLGHYDHAAFLFDLESGLKENVLNANILFLGSSRVQVAFSTDALTEFSKRYPESRPFLLGFGYVEQDMFSAKVLALIRPKPKVVVINVDPFFDHTASPHARRLLDNPREEEIKARTKRLWHQVSALACEGRLSRIVGDAICGSLYTSYRSRKDGRWISRNPVVGTMPVAYLPEQAGDDRKILDYSANAAEFLGILPIERACIIMTHIPSADSREYIPRGIADNMGTPFIAPHIPHLTTADGTHLDSSSAERWSKEFLAELAPIISRCMKKRHQIAAPAASGLVH